MMSLADAASMTGGRASGGNPQFTGVSTDTRTLRSGDLFVALRGERFDGHAFLSQAKGGGASAAMVDRGHQGEFPLPVIVVEDTKLALGTLARGWRSLFSPALIAVTGSNGKTTVKEMLAAILRAHAGEHEVLATAGNLNNDIGLPLTLLRLREHLDFMRSVEEVAAENASVFDALPASGVAVINADDAQAAFFRKAAGKRKVVDFGLDTKASVSGTYTLNPLSSEIEIRAGGKARSTLAIPGLHNVRNALAAAACAFAVGINEKTICEGLSAFRPYSGRLQVKQAPGGATVIDDTYNANPDSVRAAIDVLASCPGPTALVLGDMGEVGARSAEFHREVGSYASARKISRLYAIGEATKHAVEAFGAGGRHFDSVDELVSGIEGKSILVKGSRFMKMERVVAALTGAALGGH